MMGVGVSFGASRPIQVLKSKPSRPDSETVGPTFLNGASDESGVLNATGAPADDLAAELLALKFNIDYFSAGSAFVPGTPERIDEVAWQADSLLVHRADDPASVTDVEIADMLTKIQGINGAGTVTSCQEEEKKVVVTDPAPEPVPEPIPGDLPAPPPAPEPTPEPPSEGEVGDQ